MTRDDERISHLAGEDAGSLSAQERAGLDELRSLLAAPAIWTEPDAALEDRVVAAITTEAGAAPGRPHRRRLRLPSAGRRPYYALAGLAVAAAAAIVVAVGINGSSKPGPLRFAMAVYGTPLAPGAHGSATLTKKTSGWEIELSAAGLPHLSGSHYYQAWLKNAAGILVPVGTFNDARRVTLWSGVPATRFRTLTVTVQPANGNPASSGRRVLIGTIGARP